MQFNSRQEVESVGRAGALGYETYIAGQPVNVDRQLSSYWIASRPDDPGLSEHFRKDGFWESWITLWISRNVAAGSTCIDAGASYGYFTFHLAERGCRVIAYEANPELIPCLMKSVELNDCADRVKIVNAAVTDVEGAEIDFNIALGSGNSTIHGFTHSGDAFVATVKVKTSKLDSCLANYDRIDFIKMDIEGAEQLAWKGMQKLFAENPACICLMEFVPALYEQKGKIFFEELDSRCTISYVAYDGTEKPVPDHSFIENDTESFRMIVLRNKTVLN